MIARTRLAIVVATAALLIAGCLPQRPKGWGDLRVEPTSPRPNVDLPATATPESLVLVPVIQDSFVIPATSSVNPVPVTGWRSTLTRGFESAFIRGTSRNVLVVREAELSFGPAAVRATGATVAVRATIRFKSSVTDENGNELRRIFGEVSARDAAASPTPEAMTANAAQAIEAMYEQIGDKIAHPDD